MPPSPDIEELKAKLGVSLSDNPLLIRALTHGSVNETGGRLKSNQKLAFLGDAVIGLAIREYIFREGPNESLERLSTQKDGEVKNRRLAQLARTISLGGHLILGKGAEKERDQDSVLATAFEAVLGAIFFEKGFGAASDCTLRILRRAIPAQVEATKAMASV